MIREIKYVCTDSVDYFTCHALFSKITDGELSKLKLNAFSKQPEYKVFFQDRVVTILINDEDIKIINAIPESVDLYHRGKQLKAILYSDTPYVIKKTFNSGDFIVASGVISYAKSLSKAEIITADQSLSGEEVTRKHKSPITPYGNFVQGAKQEAIKYLESKLGIDLISQTDKRNFRFEMISYKNFESNYSVHSKTNNGKISFHNVFSFEVDGFVKDSQVVNSLEYTSIGKRRSYGFGNVFLRS